MESAGLVQVDVAKPFAGWVETGWMRRIVEEVLAAERPGEPFVVEIVIAGDELLRELNRNFRGIDEATDVLSFSGIEEPVSEDKTPVKFVMPPGVPVHLGEIVISYPRAEAQASQAGHSVEQELATLLVHGLLHLLGYDHAEPEEESRMFSRQETLVQIARRCWKLTGEDSTRGDPSSK